MLTHPKTTPGSTRTSYRIRLPSACLWENRLNIAKILEDYRDFLRIVYTINQKEEPVPRLHLNSIIVFDGVKEVNYNVHTRNLFIIISALLLITFGGYYLILDNVTGMGETPDSPLTESPAEASALTHRTLGIGFYPIWSPDGQSLLYLEDDRTSVALFDMNLGKEKIIFNSVDNYLYSINWFDNKNVLVSDRDYIYKVDIATGESAKITSLPSQSYFSEKPYLYWAINPIASPNKDKIAFEGYRKSHTPAIYVADMKGQEIEVEEHSFSPQWSTDDQIIFVHQDIEIDGKPGTPEIISKSLTTGHQEKIVDGYNPIVSPDSSSIAFQTVNGNMSILNLEKDTQKTSSWKVITVLKWSPDSSKVLVFTQPGSEPQLEIVDVNTLDSEVLASGKIESADWSPDGKSIAAGINGEIVVYELNQD